METSTFCELSYLLCKQLNKVLIFPNLHLSEGEKCMRHITA